MKLQLDQDREPQETGRTSRRFSAKLATHVATLGDPPGIGGQAESGMVVEDIQDLHLGAIGRPQWVIPPASVSGLIGVNTFHEEPAVSAAGG